MCIGIVSGIIAGLICAVMVWFFTSHYNISATEETIAHMKRLVVYLNSIGNDLAWGRDDQLPDYYEHLLHKVHFAFLNLDNARKSTRKWNFGCHKRAYILKQYSEIENGLERIMLEAEAAVSEREIVSRLHALSKVFLTTNSNMLTIRAEFVLNLLQCNSLDDALDKSCCDDDEQKSAEIEKALREL